MPQQQTALSEALGQLCLLSQQCLEAINHDDWPVALKLMAQRQTAIDALVEAIPLPKDLTQSSDFKSWQTIESHLEKAMAGLNQKQVNLDQVFAQIQSAKQHLQAYQIIPVSTTCNTHSLQG